MFLPDAAQNLWLAALLALWAALLFGGFALGRPHAENPHRMPRSARIGSSLALVAAAWSWTAFTRETPVSPYALPIAVGMTLGFVGDLFMAKLLPLHQYVFGGIVAFGLGHVVYIGGISTLAALAGLDSPAPRLAALIVWLCIGLVSWYGIIFRGQKHTPLHWAALPYALLLSGTAGVATGLALQEAAFVPLALGAALFLLSDLILAAQLFNWASFPLIHDAVWLAYGPAQALIVYSIGAALALVK
jgi:hypothetical protein